MFLVQIEDVETGQLITAPGERGKMVITNLNRRAQPCIRFDSKDLIEWNPEPCPCGRTFSLLKGGVQGRTDDITKVKGVLLSPTAIEEVVRSIPGLGDEFEVVVTKTGDIDNIALKVELTPGRDEDADSIKLRLIDQLRLMTNLNYDLEFQSQGALPRYDVKAKRFKDLRPKE